MSKKPRRSRHNPAPPPWYTPKPVEIDEDYQREVDLSTARLQARYERAEKRAAQAEARLARAAQRPASPSKRHLLSQLEREVAQRRAELEEIRRLMRAPAGRPGRVALRTGRQERMEKS